MIHPEVHRVLVDERIGVLRRAAQPVPRRRERKQVVDMRRIELRLCRVGDEPALAELGALEGKPVSDGRFVIAEVDGRVVAALPLAGGPLLADPFAPTAHLHKLLRLRAEQLRGSRGPRRLLLHPAELIRSAPYA